MNAPKSIVVWTRTLGGFKTDFPELESAEYTKYLLASDVEAEMNRLRDLLDAYQGALAYAGQPLPTHEKRYMNYTGKIQSLEATDG